MFPSYHGKVDVAGVHLHVDLLVDVSLAVGVEVLADLGQGHLEDFFGFFWVRKRRGVLKLLFSCF